MKFSNPFLRKTVPWSEACEWSILGLMVLSILWRGGKSLDMTWLLTGVAAVVTIISHTVNKSLGKRDVPLMLWLAVIGFVGLTVASYMVSTTGNYGLDEVLRTGAFGLLLFWIIRNASDQERGEEYVTRIIRLLCITVIVACGIGILVYIFQPVNRFVGTFFDFRFHTDYWPNAWAQFLLLTWPIILYWVFRDYHFDAKNLRSRAELLVRSAVIGFVLSCLFLTFSRGGFLVFLGQISLWGFIVYRKTRPQFPIRSIVPLSVVIIVVSLGCFASINTFRSNLYEVQEVGEKVTLSAAEGSSSITERFSFWSQALNLATQKPILGWGPYSFRFIQPQLQRGVLATSDHPHNIILKLLVERGVLATALFILLIWIVIYRATVQLLSDQIEVGSLKFSLRTLIYIGLMGVIAHNMIDFNLQFVGITLPFWLLLGVLMTFLDIHSLRSIPYTVAKWVEILIAVIFLVIVFYEGAYLGISSAGRAAEKAGDPFAAIEWYNKAEGEYFTRDLHLSRAKIFVQESKYSEAQDALDKYFSVNKEDFRAWKKQGDVALLSGEKQRALESYKRAFERGRYNDLSVLRGVLEAYLALDMKEEIESQRPMIDALLLEFANAIEHNAHYIALSPNIEELIIMCNMLARLYPEDAPRYQVMAAKADHLGQLERNRILSRPPGFLW
ncbi:MAG: O-antigen ligase family protein [bacterium]|nr:O-antigen ligase family protein [bacterium]